MKIRTLHTAVSLGLSFVLMLSIAIPAQAGFMLLCSMMEMNHRASSVATLEDCPLGSGMMNHSPDESAGEQCDQLIDCDCDLDPVDSTGDATPILQLKIPAAEVFTCAEEVKQKFTEYSPPPIWFSSSYSPTSLFLANKSFLI